MIVIDTNIITYLLIRGTHSKAVDRLLEKDSHWVAPRLWIDEFLKILCTYERNQILSSLQVSHLQSKAFALMDDRSYEIPPERVLSVARRTQCSGYDSQYIALAEDLGVPLYTYDKRILRQCPQIAHLPK